MTRVATHFLCLILALCLSAGAYADGALRLSHVLAQSGLTQAVICGANGAEAITLDRNGNPTDPAPSECRHCADCQLVPLVSLDAAASLSAPRTRFTQLHMATAQAPALRRLAQLERARPPDRKQSLNHADQA